MTTLVASPGRVTMFGAFDVWLGDRQITSNCQDLWIGVSCDVLVVS